jgi:hypothetical protein
MASMKHAVILIVAAISAPALATPCSGIDRTLTEDRKVSLSPIITQQVSRGFNDVESVGVLQSFHYQDWYVIYVDTHASDDAFLFYKGDPAHNDYLSLLSGTFLKQDEGKVLKSLQRGKAKEIPKPLARCIAWHVTNERDI